MLSHFEIYVESKKQGLFPIIPVQYCHKYLKYTKLNEIKHNLYIPRTYNIHFKHLCLLQNLNTINFGKLNRSFVKTP